MKSISKSASGLLLQEKFETLTGWTSAGGWASAHAPAFISWGKIGLDTQAKGASGTSDYGGVREGHLYIETIGGIEKWFLFYGAGDGTNTTAGEWRIQLATSVNKGLSWTKLGPISVGLSNGSGTAPVSRDMLYMEKRGGVYYLHAMKGLATSAVSSLGRIPASPYTSDVWTLADAGAGPVGTWVFNSNSLVQGVTGAYDDFSSYAASIVEAKSYYLFFSTTKTSSTLNIGIATSQSPSGPFTKNSAVAFPSAIEALVPENPKVFTHKLLNVYVMLLNEGSLALGTTDQNSYVLSENLGTWSLNDHVVFQKAAVNSPDGIYTIGIPSPFYKAEGEVLQPHGYVPFTYDGFPLSGSFPDIHVGRKLAYSVLEPSKSLFKYTPANLQAVTVLDDSFDGTGLLSGYNNWTQTEAGTDGSRSGGEVNIGNDATPASWVNTTGTTVQHGTVTVAMRMSVTSTGIGIIFRYQDANNYYLLDFAQNPTNINVTFYKKISGSYSTIGSVVTLSISPNTVVDAVVYFDNDDFSFSANGTLYTLTSDTAITAAGRAGLRKGNGGSGARYVSNFALVNTSTGSADTTRQATRALTHSNFTAEFAVDILNAPQTDGFISYDFRIQSGGDGYRLKCFAGGKLQLFKVVSGVETSLAAQSGSNLILQGYPNRVKVKASGSTLTAWLNSEQQVNVTDTTWSSGVKVGVAGFNNIVGIRNLNIYSTDTLTVTGLTAGEVVVPRSFGSIPLEVRTATGSSETFTITHYPIASIDVAGEEIKLEEEALIWGGDTLAVTTPSSGGSTVLNFAY